MPKKFGSEKGIKGLEARDSCEGRVHQRMGVQWWNRGNIHTGYPVNSQITVQEEKKKLSSHSC